MKYGLVVRLVDGTFYVGRFETLNEAFAALRGMIRRRDARGEGRKSTTHILRRATFAICELDRNNGPTDIAITGGMVEALVYGNILPNDDEELARALFDEFRVPMMQRPDEAGSEDSGQRSTHYQRGAPLRCGALEEGSGGEKHDMQHPTPDVAVINC